MVLEGDEVEADGLSERIRGAAYLLFLIADDGSLGGVSALKRPAPNYRAGLFAKANSNLQPEAFPLELGWIVVAKQHRGFKLSRVLVEQLLRVAEGQNIYCTTRADNVAMQRTNQRCGFTREGAPYKSKHGDYFLDLFVR